MQWEYQESLEQDTWTAYGVNPGRVRASVGPSKGRPSAALPRRFREELVDLRGVWCGQTVAALPYDAAALPSDAS